MNDRPTPEEILAAVWAEARRYMAQEKRRRQAEGEDAALNRRRYLDDDDSDHRALESWIYGDPCGEFGS